jgi:diacylglycerol O-acyltransferase / wax synthase
MTGISLTAIEASFLELEHPGNPMNVSGVILLEGGEPITLDALHGRLAARIRRLPRFRERIAADLTRCVWMPESRVDLAAHIHRHRLHAPASLAHLFATCAQLHATPLSHEGPLWRIHLIDGVAGGRQAVMITTHHALGDGIAGVEIGDVLLDAQRGHRRMHSTPATRYGTAASRPPLSTLQALFGLVFTAAGGPIAVAGPFNGPVGAQRAFAGATLSMPAIRAVKAELGVSVDDVLVAAVAAGLRRYLLEVGYPEIPHALRAMIPVSTRVGSRDATMGNHVTSIFIDLPLDSGDLDRIARRVAAEKSVLRAMHAAEGASMLVEATGHLPPPVHGFVLGLAARLPFANLVLSDIPGAREPRTLLGRRAVACYPMMPLAPAIGLSIAAISSCDVMAVGVTVDPDLVPEPQKIASSIARVVAERFATVSS